MLIQRRVRMCYKTILVCLNDIKSADELLKVSIDLAHKNSGHLIGLYVKTIFDVSPHIGQGEIPGALFQQHEEQEEKISKELEAKFRDKTNLANISAEWSSVRAYSPDIKGQILNRARCCDLIVVSQGDPSGPDTGQDVLAHNLVIEGGRPILVIPRDRVIHSVGEFPLVAWNASHQASRAVFDALPFLKQAKMTNITWINPSGFPDSDIEMAGSEIATSLSRHDIKANIVHNTHRPTNIGTALLDMAKENGSDMIVMGGYGHSRLSEYLFGGATYHILKHMTIPIFLSH